MYWRFLVSHMRSLTARHLPGGRSYEYRQAVVEEETASFFDIATMLLLKAQVQKIKTTKSSRARRRRGGLEAEEQGSNNGNSNNHSGRGNHVVGENGIRSLPSVTNCSRTLKSCLHSM